MNVIQLLKALGVLWSDFLAIYNVMDWAKMKPALEKLRTDLLDLIDAFGGADKVSAALASATDDDYAIAWEGVCADRLTGYPEDSPGKFGDGTILKFLITYGPVIYNIIAPFFGLPPIPIPTPTPTPSE